MLHDDRSPCQARDALALVIRETRCVRVLNFLAKLLCGNARGNLEAVNADSLSCQRRGQAIPPKRSKTPVCGLMMS
jgi:hypothetical protein